MKYEDLPHCKYCGYRHYDNKAHMSEQDSLGCIREMLKTVIDQYEVTNTKEDEMDEPLDT